MISTDKYYGNVLGDLLRSGCIETSTENMLEEIETEEDEGSSSIFRDDLNVKKLLIDVLRVSSSSVFLALTCPIWLLYDELITPIHGLIIRIRYEHEHMVVHPARKLSRSEKTELIITGIIASVLLIILVYLAYLMSK